MRYAYTVAQTRALENATMATVGEATLMQRAAHGLAGRAADLLARTRGTVYGSRVMIVVGPGNNGGDALYAGQRLARRGCSVTAVRALGRPHPDGLAALLAAGGRLVDGGGLSVDDLAGVDLVVDGLLGIGGRPGLPADVLALTAAATVRGLPVLAVDLPSGVVSDTGQAPSGSVHATRTVTFGCYKPGHLIEPAASRCGRIELVDIGLDLGGTVPALAAWDPDDVATHWPFPGPTSDKYARGVVGLDTGSDAYPGAGVLSTHGAVYGGAGMVRFLGAQRSAEIIARDLPNVVFGDGRVQCWLVGSGWGERADGDRAVADRVASGLPLVIDADGLRHLPDRLPGTVLLTPHAGELARLLQCERGDVTADPVAAVRSAADRTGATVLLKGATQLVATAGTETVEVAVPGPAWTGQAGSGDVLGGLCAAVLAAGVGARTAAVLAASVQAMTAARFVGPLPPQELARHCATVIGELGRGPGGRRGEHR
ncbi:bifunctional ADP-dependent NAD(P)H-hydrate dehydratase/NAD(P)H-hydrate epimerase [Microlunatus aurantiacus]|uniref:Bifunctional NAD(P)H-hydrate repair enzyme n=1 Tax=Microlunatus aurantiacus TaxID=446786 RepID=A0ABP7CLP3_9ACTN